MADHLETYGSENLILWTMKEERILRQILFLKTCMTIGRHTTIQIRVPFGGMTKNFGKLK